MKQSPSSRRGRSSKEVQTLMDFAEGISQSGSRAEDRFWNSKLEKEIKGRLIEMDEFSLNAALDKLSERESRAHEELADAIEGSVEYERVIDGNSNTDTLLIAIPLIAWSRLGLSTKILKNNQLNEIKKALKSHVLSNETNISIANFLFSPDQLPESFVETRNLRISISSCLPDKHFHVDVKNLKETTKYLADQRYFLGVVSAPSGKPIFQWQDGISSKDEILVAWKKVGGKVISKIMPQCAYELILPRAYYVACRDADRSSRQFSIEASIDYLSSSLAISSDSLIATVGGCYNRHLEEYRISFSTKNSDKVIHGVIWPLLGPEDELSDIIDEVVYCLKKCGVTHCETLTQRLPMEYCEECGSPLYPNIEGEMTHAEFPESDDESTHNLH